MGAKIEWNVEISECDEDTPDLMFNCLVRNIRSKRCKIPSGKIKEITLSY
jgi:hypothetical protein